MKNRLKVLLAMLALCVFSYKIVSAGTIESFNGNGANSSVVEYVLDDSGNLSINGNFVSTGTLSTVNDVRLGISGTAATNVVTAAGNSHGVMTPIYLSGSNPAFEGSLIVATNSVAGSTALSGIVRIGDLPNTLNWIGIAAAAASTGSIVDVYTSGFVMALTSGPVLPGQLLVSTNTYSSYLVSTGTVSSGNALVGIAMSSGTTAGGLTPIRLR